MIISGKNFARIADGIYSFHIEFHYPIISIIFTDATGGEVFKIEKKVKNKKFPVELLRDMLITELLYSNLDSDQHKFDILDIESLITNIDENPDEVAEYLNEEVDPNLERYYTLLFKLVVVDEAEDKTVKELKKIVEEYMKTGKAPEWALKAWDEEKKEE